MWAIGRAGLRGGGERGVCTKNKNESVMDVFLGWVLWKGPRTGDGDEKGDASCDFVVGIFTITNVHEK